ncbi:transcription intermediary factor 1-beta-like [Ruditapes philippinarum]|uniref:transcription intermediary factor 1-beta-like n=1 Tax=Ruditapes philippinarum TaxID=129788 RepID=UPI00295C018C|nr:transcription intermediary factor 1-beta-like [Ruditapes philippinarum]
MEVPGRKESSDDKVKRKCQPCQDENVLHEAYGYCITCGKYLCDACFKYHRRPKPSKDHVLVECKTILSKERAPTPPDPDKHKVSDDQDLQQGENNDKCKTKKSPPPVPSRKGIFNTKCSVHPSEDLKYQCKSHEIIVCSECALKQHRQCDELYNIHDIYDSESKRIFSKIQYVEDKAAYILKQETNANEDSDVSYEEVLSQIRLDREQVNKYFDETEKRLNNEVYRFREGSKKRQTEVLDICQKLKTKKDLIRDTNLSEIERYISMTEGEGEVDNIKRDLKGVFGLSLRVSYKSQYQMLDSENFVVEKHQRRKLKLQKKHCIQSCDMSGNILRDFPYIDDKMRGPFGITADQFQSIYVCGFNCLSVVSIEGEWNELLTSDGGFAPQSLLVSNRSDRLYVGQTRKQSSADFDFLIFEL